MNEGPDHRGGDYGLPPGPGTWLCSGLDLSLLPHRVKATPSLSGSQLSDLQVGRQGRTNAARREGRWEHRQEVQLEMSGCPRGQTHAAPGCVHARVCVCVCVCAVCQQREASSLKQAVVSTCGAASAAPPVPKGHGF